MGSCGNGKLTVFHQRKACHGGNPKNGRKGYQLLTPAERSGQEPPANHRFPKGFHRGIELFGQHSNRLREPGYRDFIAKHGLTLVEGFNDVINLDNLGIPALGIMSNRMTDAQGEKVAAWAKQMANGRVNIMFDCEPSGVEGAKEALWFFAERQLEVRLLWSPAMHGGKSQGWQPESLNSASTSELFSPRCEALYSDYARSGSDSHKK